jgi:hypothetical protein
MDTLVESPGLAWSLGEQGRKHVVEKFLANIVVDRYETLYRGDCAPCAIHSCASRIQKIASAMRRMAPEVGFVPLLEFNLTRDHA